MDNRKVKIMSFDVLKVNIVWQFEDTHNSWLYCFTNPLELGTCVSLSHRQPYVTHVKQYNQELCISSNSRYFTKRFGSRPLN